MKSMCLRHAMRRVACGFLVLFGGTFEVFAVPAKETLLETPPHQVLTETWEDAALASSGAVLLDRVVAVVDKQVITLSELYTEARIALVEREGVEAAIAIEFDSSLLAHFLDYVINQTLIARQVRRLEVGNVDEADLEKERSRFMERFPSQEAYLAFLQIYDISEQTIVAILYRNLQNGRFTSERMIARVPVTPQSGHRRPNPAEHSGTKLEAISIQANARAGYHESLQRWLLEMRSMTEIRLLGAHGELEKELHDHLKTSQP